jgi:hypothetical protein
VGVRRCLDGVVEEADGRGEPGRRDGGKGGRHGRKKGGGGRLGTHLTGGPHLSVAPWEGGREGGGRWWAGVGRKRGIGPWLDKEKEGGEDGLGRRGERVRSFLFFFFFFFSFSNPFQIFFKPF